MGQTKNKVTAAMLAFFTGFIGGHKLYLNKIGGFIVLYFYFGSQCVSIFHFL